MKKMILALFMVGCGGVMEVEMEGVEENHFAAGSPPSGYCQVDNANKTTGKCVHSSSCAKDTNTCSTGVLMPPMIGTICGKRVYMDTRCN
jgi:hypothetical protein